MGLVEGARKLCDTMLDKDVVTWNDVIKRLEFYFDVILCLGCLSSVCWEQLKLEYTLSGTSIYIECFIR